MAIRFNKEEVRLFESIALKDLGFNVRKMTDSQGEAVAHISRKIDENYNCLFTIVKKKKDEYLIAYNDTDSNILRKNNTAINTILLKNRLQWWVGIVRKEIEFEIDEFDFNLSKSTYHSLRFAPLVRNAIKITKEIDEECGGMILRKAIEVLFVDYFKNKIPSLSNDIDSKYNIGSKINVFYDKELNIRDKYQEYKHQLTDIKPFISAISEIKNLGNDFAHYERELEKYSVHDLIEFIKSIVDFLVHEIDMKVHKKKLNSSKQNLSKIKIKK